jgi:para-nitrobenzyl esterase
MRRQKIAFLWTAIAVVYSATASAQDLNLQTWLNEFVAPVHANKSPKEKEITLQTPLGLLRGSAVDNLKIFRGIRYAEAPVGDHRFAPPVATTAWKGMQDATNFGHMCYQPGQGDFSEDCLFLNVWTPAKKPQDKLPVYVFIHGGGFSMGAGSQPLYEGANLAQSGVIVVTLNYRLGTLGFLPSKAAHQKYGTTGNWGMLDMIEALKWVQSNIQSFGGDPTRVTIGGESAGSFAVSTLINSPKAKGLFNQAIMESGALPMVTAVAPATALSFRQAKAESAKYFAKFDLKDDVQGLTELRKLPVDKIVATQLQYPQLRMPQVSGFFPIPDGSVYQTNPVNAIKEGRINQVKLLAGFNTDEGSLFVPPTTAEKDYNALVKSAFGKNAEEVLSRYPAQGQQVVSQMNQMVTLGLLRSGMYQYADALSKNNDVYMYHFDFVDPMIKNTGLGVIHGSEIKYVFHNFMNEINKHEDAKQVAQLMKNSWVNFIKTGNPNDGELLPNSIQWSKYNTSQPQELRIRAKTFMEPMYKAEDVKFFNKSLQMQY